MLNNYQNNNNTNNECQVYATSGRLWNGKEKHRLQVTSQPKQGTTGATAISPLGGKQFQGRSHEGQISVPICSQESRNNSQCTLSDPHRTLKC